MARTRRENYSGDKKEYAFKQRGWMLSKNSTMPFGTVAWDLTMKYGYRFKRLEDLSHLNLLLPASTCAPGQGDFRPRLWRNAQRPQLPPAASYLSSLANVGQTPAWISYIPRTVVPTRNS